MNNSQSLPKLMNNAFSTSVEQKLGTVFVVAIRIDLLSLQTHVVAIDLDVHFYRKNIRPSLFYITEKNSWHISRNAPWSIFCVLFINRTNLMVYKASVYIYGNTILTLL